MTQFAQVATPNLTDCYTLPFTPWYMFRICGVCAVYEKVWTIIRRTQYIVDLNMLRKYLT